MSNNEYFFEEEEVEINSNFCKIMFSEEEINQKYIKEIEDDKSNQYTTINTDSLEAKISSNTLDDGSVKYLTKKKKPSNNIKKNNSKRKYDDDNIRSKIKNNFLRFVINFLNENIKEEYGHQKLLFRKPEYTDLRNKKENKEFLQKKLFEFISENDISQKYKTKDPEQNKKHLKKFILNDNSIVSNFLNMTMEFIYNNYFLNKKHEKYKKILFFDDFIEELEKKEDDKNYIEKVKKIAKENYVSYYKNYNEENENFTKIKFNVFKDE